MANGSKSDGPDGDGTNVPPGGTDLPDRLRDLDARLNKFQAETGRDRSKGYVKEGAAYGRALKHVSEFVGGTMAGLLLGWLTDLATGWFPLGLVTGLILGFVTGFWNIYKSSLRSGGS